MSAKQRLEKAKRLTGRINAEIIRAIALQSMWARCAAEAGVINALRKEIWFPVVRDIFHIDLLMTLCRMHEHGREENATIPVIVSMAEESGLQRLLVDKRAFGSALALYRDLQKSGLVRQLRTVRDRILAHNDMRRTEITATYGDETMLLSQSAQIAGHLHMAVAGSNPQFELYQTAWRLAADSFWYRLTNQESTTLR